MTETMHALAPDAVARVLGSDLDRGLSGTEAAARLAEHGRNEPGHRRRPPYARLALHQLTDPLVALLIAAAVVSMAIGDVTEGAAIAAILVLNAALGFWQEAGAERAILALTESFSQDALVVRDGTERAIPSAEVVPGDVLLVRAGERAAADARVVETRALDMDESALTGESLPVAKSAGAVAATTPLAERTSMIHAGTGVTRGAARTIVVGTAKETELGRIQVLAEGAKPPTTPLTRRLGRLARQMVVVGVAVTVLLGGVIVARGGAWHEAFLTSVAVAVAAVPEGLAATVTAALALGARAIAGRGAIVRQLAAIETLGETTEICTDKTGTLTQNEIRVAALRPAPGVDETMLLRDALRASSVVRLGERVVGDPIEVAIVLAAMERGIDPADSADASAELPFTADRKRMTVVRAGHAYTKGAPEVFAARVREHGRELLRVTEEWATDGFRVLAVATRPVRAGEALDERLETGLALSGVIALHDPLRASSAASVDAAHAAGIHVRMLTGDHPATARTIGLALGLGEDAIVARATPADKLALVEELQRDGHVVAVTGDGVNDAPALRRADVGVAMGRSGTEAAREAAAIVLTDDDFSTIVAAIAEGRRIGDNIRKFVAFLLSANFGEVLLFAVAVTAGLGTPLAVIQVLIVNLVTDGLPALALARDPATRETMNSPPRRGAALFDRQTWQALAFIGVLVGCATLAAYAIGRSSANAVGQTMAFATLALSELALVYGMRSQKAPAWTIPSNRWLNASVLGSIAVLAMLVYLPTAHDAFATVSLSTAQALTVVALALVPLALTELMKAYFRGRGPRLLGVTPRHEAAR